MSCCRGNRGNNYNNCRAYNCCKLGNNFGLKKSGCSRYGSECGFGIGCWSRYYEGDGVGYGCSTNCGFECCGGGCNGNGPVNCTDCCPAEEDNNYRFNTDKFFTPYWCRRGFYISGN